MITSSPSETPTARSPRCSAEVPDDTAEACLAPTLAANAASKAGTRGPSESWPEPDPPPGSRGASPRPSIRPRSVPSSASPACQSGQRRRGIHARDSGLLTGKYKAGSSPQQGTRLFFTVPSRIFATLWQMFATGTIWAPLGVSATAFAIGLGLAVAAGLPLGILLGRSATLNAMFDPFVTAFNATPRLVFLPLLMLWLGIGLWSKVAVVFLGALFPLLINTHEGVRNADKLLINVVRSFGASGWNVARLVVVPNALPFIVVGLRLAIGRAILGVVVAEFFGAQDGLGVVMVRAASSFNVDVVFAGLVVFAALSLVITGLVKLIEDRMSRWRPQRTENE